LIRTEKITFLQQSLLEWYSVSGRHFPWRNKSITNYQKVIAEVLLQRTKAETVAKFYIQFIIDYPSWKSYHMEPFNGDVYVKQIRDEEHLDNIPILFYTNDPDVDLHALIPNCKDVYITNKKSLEDKVKEFIFPND